MRRGQVLATLHPTADDSYARAKGEVEHLERTLAREERLLSAGAIPSRRVEDTRHSLRIARTELESMGGESDSDDLTVVVRSPISGVVARRNFTAGGHVSSGTPLYTIVDPSTVWLHMDLQPATAAAIDRGTPVSFTIDGSDRTYWSSAPVTVGSVVDSASRTVPARASVANSDGALRIGLYTQARVPVGESLTGLAVPNSAIIDDNGTPVAYVQTEGEAFERRTLQLGTTGAEYSLVLDGVAEGEMVVTVGAYQIRLASLSGNEFAGGHAH